MGRGAIIQAGAGAGQPEDWRRAMRDCVTDPAELLEILELDPALLPAARAATRLFGLRVPRSYLARIAVGDPQDPLLRQVLPLGDELDDPPGFTEDPVGESQLPSMGGVLHKYPGRALLVTTGACGIHCRYCFRRHFPYSEQSAARDRWSGALERIAADETLEEVILSGGDPLTLSTTKLAELTRGLGRIDHVRRLRIHTRQPVVIPERVDAALLDWLGDLPWPTALVLHVNHAHELDERTAQMCRALADTGVQLLNQSVLLRGVNDDVEALAALSEALFGQGVLPYYLHMLDPVKGAAHHQVDESTALELHARLAARTSGYLVPRLVREVAGEPGKTLL